MTVMLLPHSPGRLLGRAGRGLANGGGPPMSQRALSRIVLVTALAVTSAAAAASASAASPPGGGTAVPVVWEAASSSVANLSRVDPALAAGAVGTARSLIQATAPLSSNPVQAGFHSLPTERWTSE